jgi:hypothetical protein
LSENRVPVGNMYGIDGETNDYHITLHLALQSSNQR